jgi:hypothetical protein
MEGNLIDAVEPGEAMHGDDLRAGRTWQDRTRRTNTSYFQIGNPHTDSVKIIRGTDSVGEMKI